MSSPQQEKQQSHEQRTQPSPLFLLLFPLTLLTGSLFAALSPTASPSFSTSSPSVPPNYFARKDNLFNAYFVKIGWVWMTAAFGVLVFLAQGQRSGSGSGSSSAPRQTRIAQSAVRYFLATTAWFFTTQWFFGPAVIDRSFVVTGGKCADKTRGLGSVYPYDAASAGESETETRVHTLFSAAACKAAGGTWEGGHDVSGHVFMLVLVVAVLGFEGWGVLFGENEKREKEHGDAVRKWAVRFVAGVVGLSWWMLLMTAVWFHTWLEKWNGLAIALGAVYVIYILPRRSIPWRNIVGVPGV